MSGLPCSECKFHIKIGDRYFPYSGQDICERCAIKMGIENELYDKHYLSKDDVVPLFPSLVRQKSSKIITGNKPKLKKPGYSTTYLPITGKPIVIIDSKKIKPRKHF